MFLKIIRLVSIAYFYFPWKLFLSDVMVHEKGNTEDINEGMTSREMEKGKFKCVLPPFFFVIYINNT